MAVAVTLIAGVSDPVDRNSYPTGSSSPANGSRLYVFTVNIIAFGTATEPVVSGLSATWTNIFTVQTSGYRLTLTESSIISGSPSGVVTIGFSGVTQSNCQANVFEVTGQDATTPHRNLVNATATGTAVAVAFAAFLDAGNGAIYFAAAAHGTATWTPGSGYTELLDSRIAEAFADQTATAGWRADNDPTPNADCTLSASAVWFIIAIELNTVAVSGGVPVKQYDYRRRRVAA